MLEHSFINTLDLEISSIVVKIASRCNLNCDYCYMYHHVDQSYKNQPKFISDHLPSILATRIEEYIDCSSLDFMKVCLHGGEPLIAGFRRIENFLSVLKNRLKERVVFSIQTNGLLLNREFLDLFRKYDVKVSLSLDGPKRSNDKHRLDHRGHSVYEKVEKSLNLLTDEYKELFVGIISVIDPTNNPEEIIDFFAAINPPTYDLLLPDATHLTPPPGRKESPQLYVDWISRALTHWHTHHPYLRVRTFLNACEGVLGNQTESELFGNGSISYLIVETDGSYHFSDMLKAAYEGASHTGLSIDSHTLTEVIRSPAIQRFQSLIHEENKSDICLRCPEYKICGSGQIIHRYGHEGFGNPSVYCQEMFSMIRKARHLVFKSQIATIYYLPKAYAKEIAEMFFSDRSIYLFAEMLQYPSHLSLESLEHGFLFQENHPETVEFENTYFSFEKRREKIDTQKGLMVEILEMISASLPYLYREMILFCREIFFLEVKQGDDMCCFCELMSDKEGSCRLRLHCFFAKEIESQKIAPVILVKYLTQKFSLFHRIFPLLEKFNRDHLNLFHSVYIHAHLLRLFQFFVATNHLAYKNKTLELISKLMDEVHSLRSLDLSGVGFHFLEEIIKEFIPDLK